MKLDPRLHGEIDCQEIASYDSKVRLKKTIVCINKL